jgi:hypothetical protein
MSALQVARVLYWASVACCVGAGKQSPPYERRRPSSLSQAAILSPSHTGVSKT